MRIIVWVVSVCLGACTQTASIVDNVCGNGVLEAGEDCDAPASATCTQTCRIACVIGTANACPGTSACGVDGVCHAPSGTLQAEIVEPFDTTTFVVADIDGDHFADAVGVGNGQLVVRYGDAQSPFTRSFTTSAPASTGQVGFGDLTGDGRTDVVIPTAGGLFAFETTTGTPSPIPFPARTDSGLTHEQIGVTTTGLLAYVDFNAAGSNYLFGVLPHDFGDPTVAPAKPCNRNENNPPTGRTLHPYSDLGRLLLPLQLNNGAICVAQVGTSNFQLIQPFSGYHPPPYGETFFAKILGNACPDLLVPVATVNNTSKTMVFAGIGAPGSCAIAPTSSTILIGAPLATFTLAATGNPTMVLTTAGIVEPATTTLVTVATKATWTYAAVSDLDHDGAADLVIASSTTDVEVLFQLPATANTPQFEDVELSTTGTPAMIAVGDYDGDGNGDIAIGNVDGLEGDASAELLIAWGGASGGFVMTDAGAFSEPHDLVTIQLTDGSIPVGFDHYDDLVIAQGGNTPTDLNDPALLIAEYGSANRELTAPYIFLSTLGMTGDTSVRTTGKGAIIGNYGTNGTLGAYAQFGTDSTATAVALSATSYGNFVASVDTPLDACSLPGVVDKAFCASNAHFSRVARTGNSAGDVVLGIRSDADGGALSQCMVYATAAATKPTPVSCAELAEPDNAHAADELAGLVNVTIPRVFGSPDGYELTLAHVTGKSTATMFDWTLTVAADGKPHLTNPIDYDFEIGALTGGAAYCMDAIELELGTHTVDNVEYGAGHEERVIACETGAPLTTKLYARYAATDSLAPGVYTQLVDTGLDQVIRLREGDVNGDGLDDIIYSLASGAVSKLDAHILFQCDTHETGCVGGGL